MVKTGTKEPQKTFDSAKFPKVITHALQLYSSGLSLRKTPQIDIQRIHKTKSCFYLELDSDAHHNDYETGLF